jgi:hypothetical protein
MTFQDVRERTLPVAITASNVRPFPRKCFRCKNPVFWLTVAAEDTEQVVVEAVDPISRPWGYILFTEVGRGVMIPDDLCDTEEPLYVFHRDVCDLYDDTRS